MNQENAQMNEQNQPETILNYKLYYGGYYDIKGFTVAKNQEEAINKLREQLHLYSLPCDAEELVIPDFDIILTPKIE